MLSGIVSLNDRLSLGHALRVVVVNSAMLSIFSLLRVLRRHSLIGQLSTMTTLLTVDRWSSLYIIIRRDYAISGVDYWTCCRRALLSSLGCMTCLGALLVHLRIDKIRFVNAQAWTWDCHSFWFNHNILQRLLSIFDKNTLWYLWLYWFIIGSSSTIRRPLLVIIYAYPMSAIRILFLFKALLGWTAFP